MAVNLSRRFGPFHFAPETGELSRSGAPVRLRPQPARALALLTSRPGRVVTREELRALLWADTVVDFDKSLNFVILQLRRALEDDAERPTYVETVPRVGYRFIAPVQAAAPARSRARVGRALVLVLVVLLALVGIFDGGGGWPKGVGTSSPEARAAYLKATYLLGRSSGDLEQALEFLDDALAADPGFAQAWLALAGAHLRRTLSRGTHGELARAAVERALALEPDLALAHVRLGDVRSVVDWDWEGAARAYERALELDPELAEAHHHYATHFSIRGDLEGAIREIERALELDPVSVRILGDAGWKYLYIGRFDEARKHCQKTLELEPKSLHGWECLVHAHEAGGRVPAALEAARRHLELLGVDLAVRAGELDLASYRALVLERLEELGERVSPVDLAFAHAAVGNSETAIELLHEARRRRLPRLVFQIRDPRLRVLRSEPAFPDLVRSLGLPSPL